jgi:hypothetical protein
MENFKFSTRFTLKLCLYFSLKLRVECLEAVSIAFFRGPCSSQLASPADCNDFWFQLLCTPAQFAQHRSSSLSSCATLNIHRKRTGHVNAHTQAEPVWQSLLQAYVRRIVGKILCSQFNGEVKKVWSEGGL